MGLGLKVDKALPSFVDGIEAPRTRDGELLDSVTTASS